MKTTAIVSDQYAKSINELMTNKPHRKLIFQMACDIVGDHNIDGADISPLIYRDYYFSLCKKEGIQPITAHIGLAKDACVEMQEALKKLRDTF